MNPNGVPADGEMVNACPECDGTRLSHRPGGYIHTETDSRWKCRECGAGFEKPERRKARWARKPKGLAGRLLDADPDDVGAD